MNYAGKFDAAPSFNDQGATSPAYIHVDSFTAKGHGTVPAGAFVVPDANLLFHGDFKRAGVDLILSNDGHEFVLHDYFKGEKRAAIASPDGAHLTGDIVNALAGHVQYAQAAPGAGAAQVIGHVTKMTGSATAVRNGVSIILNQGDNVEKGDVVSTGSDSTLGITFIDGTVFGLSNNARMVLNEMVYDPNGSNNSSLLSLVAGTITFVAGQTAKHGDMKIDTPVATMGIRGTAVLTEINFTVPSGGGDPQPQANFQVLVEPDGTTGSYILFDKITLLPIATVNQAGQMIQISGGNVSITNALLSPEVQKLITDVFTLKFTDNNTNTKLTNNSTDTITPDSNGFTIKTASGATAEVKVVNTVVTGNDGQQPANGDKPSTNNRIPGAPEARSLDLAGHPSHAFSLSERGGQTNVGTDLDTVSGTVTFLDFNLGDKPTVKVNFADAYTYKDAGQHDVTASLSALQKQDIAATEVKIIVLAASGNNNNGSAIWTYSVPDNAFDFLAAGETLTLNYIIRVDNNFEANNETAFIPISITITGTNDKPVVTTDVPTIVFAGGTSVPGGPLTSDVPTSGTLTFTDVDLTDTHTVSVQLTGATLPGGTVPPGPLAIFQHALSVSIANSHDSTGTGTGTVNWSLADLPVYLADFIPKDEVLTLTYTVTVTDSQGATTTQTITVTITGTDSPAVVWIATTQAGSPPGGFWKDAANWETGTVPTINDDVIVITDQLHGLTPSYPVTIDAAAFAKSLTMNDFGGPPPELINQSTLTISGALNMSADSILTNASTGTIVVGGKAEILDTSKLSNAGMLKLQAGGDIGSQVDLTNSGTIDLVAGTLNLLADIANADGTVQVDDGARLVVDSATVDGGTVVISGALELDGASVLKNGILTNSGAVTVNGTVAFQDETVTNAATGLIEVLAGGVLAVAATTAATVTNDGTIQVDGGELDVNGEPIGNAGTLAAINHGTIKLTSATVTNTGSGAISVDATSTLDLADATIDGGTLSISGTLESTGTSAINGADIINDGTITVTSGTLTIDPPGLPHHIANHHAIEVDGGALKLINVVVDNYVTGTVTVGNGSSLYLTDVEINGGTLGNAGRIYGVSGFNIVTAAVTNSGIIEVQGGTLDLAAGLSGAGTLIIDDGGTLELAGASAQTVTFNGGTDTLQLDDVAGQQFNGTIAGISSASGTFIVTGAGNITTLSGDALDFTSDGGASDDPADIVLTPTGTLTGAANGIAVIQNGVGDVSVTTGGDVTGLAGDGIRIIQDGADAAGSTHVTNNGSVVGADGHAAIYIQENTEGTALIDNSGAIGPDGAVTSSTFAIVETGGAITINNTGEINGTISVATATFNNELTGTWTVAGTSVFGVASLIDNDGQINLHGASISGDGLHIDNSGNIDSWGTSSISGVITNTGNIEINDGTLTLFGSLSGSGSVTLDEGATLELAGTVSQTVNFLGSGASELQIDTATFDGTIAGLGIGDKIDLSSIHYDLATTTATYNAASHELTVTDGINSITLKLDGDYSNAHFAGSDDGHNGTMITLKAADDAPNFAPAEDTQSASFAELEDTTGSSTPVPVTPATGTIHFTDVDLTDRPTATITDQQLTWTDTDNTDLSAGLTDGEKYAIKHALTLSQTDRNSGTVDWSYSIADGALDFLGEGQTVTLLSTITLDDHQTGTDTAQVTVTITGKNDAPTVTAVVATGDSTGADLTETNASQAAHGTLTLADPDLTDVVGVSVAGVTHTGPTGGLSDATLLSYFSVPITAILNSSQTSAQFTWNFDSHGEAFDFLGVGETLTLQYTIQPSDGHQPTGGGSTVVTINIAGTNDALVANDDLISSPTIYEDTNAALTTAQLLANDTDVNPGVTLTVTSVGDLNGHSLHGGTVSLNGNTITYHSAPDYNGPDSFSYTVSDGTVNSIGTALFNVVAVNDAPVAVGDTLSASEDTPVTYTSAQLLGNDTDVDNSNAQLSIASVTSGVGGTAVLNPDGTVTFTPSENFNGAANFTYTVSDGAGTSNTATVTVNVSPVNDAPTGSVTISGLAQEGHELTASNTLGDADGLGTISYQWQRDGVNVDGSTGATYTLGNADVGHTIDVVASYTDGHGTLESKASAATAPVSNVNDAPTGSVTISGLAQEGHVLTASNTLGDADGLGAISYQWQRDGVNVDGATGTTYTLGNADVGHTIDVVASYTDGHGTLESKASAATAPVSNVNDAPTGSVTISGLAQEGHVLTASNTLNDADGLGAISYQWQRDGVNVDGSTGATYTLGNADVGHTIDVVASYTDGHGTLEIKASAATLSVAAAGIIVGDSGDNTLTGTPGNDVFQGFGGNDTIDGLSGSDLAIYTDATGGITVNLTAGTVSGAGVGTDSLTGIESIRGSNFDDHYSAVGFFGDTGIPSSPIGFNSFEGMGGDDIIAGTVNSSGQILTRISYVSATGPVTVDFAAGTADGDASVGHDTFTNVNAVVGSAFDDVLRGSDNPNGTYESYDGRAGNDLIDGRGGFDQAHYNNDSSTTTGIVVNLAAGIVTGDATVGTDTLRSVESVRGTNFVDTYNATGFSSTSTNAGSNGTFNNFDGEGGDDIIIGNGNTRIQYSQSTDGVTVDFVLGTAIGDGSVGTDHFSGVNAVMGSMYVDSFAGSAGNENFMGLAGDDFIDGRGGFDVAQYDNLTYTTGGINVQLAAGTVTGDTSIGTDTLRAIEGIQGTYFDDTYNAAGFSGTSTNAGSYGSFNQFEGMHGNDTIIGNGNTRIAFGSARGGVTVDLAAGTSFSTAPNDAANVGIDTFSGVNSVIGSAFADNVAGNDSVNIFIAGGGNDIIDGAGGTDLAVLSGPAATYTISFDTPSAGKIQVADSVPGRDGTDTLSNVEALQFSDATVLVASGTIANPLNLAALTAGIALKSVTTLTGAASDFVLVNMGMNGLPIDLGGGTADTVFVAAPGFYNLNLVNVEKVVGSSGDDIVVLQNVANGLTVDLGAGNNTLALANGSNTLAALNAGIISSFDLSGDVSNDTLTLLNNVDGVTINLGQGVNTLDLSSGANTLNAAFGVNSISGTASTDILTIDNAFAARIDLGTGNDTLYLGTNANQITIVYNSGDGADIISGFKDAQGDKIDVTGVNGIYSLADIQSHATTVNGDTVIDFGSGDTLTLQGVTSDSLISSDFVFGTPAPAITGNLSTVAVKGLSVKLTTGSVTANLMAVDPGHASDQLVFTVTGTSHGHIASSAGGFAITSFTQAQLDSGSVFFVSDSPTYVGQGGFTVSLSDGVAGRPSTVTTVGVTMVDAQLIVSSLNPNDYNFDQDNPLGAMGAGVVSGVTPTSFTITNAAVNRQFTVAGSDFVYDSQNHVFTAGTITSIVEMTNDTAHTPLVTFGLNVPVVDWMNGVIAKAQGDDSQIEALASKWTFNVVGNAHADSFGTSGLNDSFTGNGGNDTFDGQYGYDRANYGNATGPIQVHLADGTVNGDASVGTDTLRSVELVTGSNYNDTFDATGFSSASTNSGSIITANTAGMFNEFEGRGGDDTITGNGVTRVSYSHATSAIAATFSGWASASSGGSGTVTGDDSTGTDTFTGVYSVRGSSYDDHFYGSNNPFGSAEEFEGRGGDDYIDGGAGFDRARYDGAVDGVGITVDLAAGTVSGGSDTGSDTLRSIEAIWGTNYADFYDARNFTASNVTTPSLNSGSAPRSGIDNTPTNFNEFEGGGGNDTIYGNTNTRVNYTHANSGVTVTLGSSGSGYADGDSSVGHDTFVSGVNAVRGSEFNDIITGNGGFNTLEGRGGNDVLDGGGGSDSLSGGTGSDIFVYKPGYGVTTITDFSHASDRIDLRAFAGVHGIGDLTLTVSGNTLTVTSLAGGFNDANHKIVIQGYDPVSNPVTASDFIFNSATHDSVAVTVQTLDGYDFSTLYTDMSVSTLATAANTIDHIFAVDNAKGITFELIGSSFSYDLNGHVTGGTITEIDILSGTDPTQTTQDHILVNSNGWNIDATNFFSALTQYGSADSTTHANGKLALDNIFGSAIYSYVGSAGGYDGDGRQHDGADIFVGGNNADVFNGLPGPFGSLDPGHDTVDYSNAAGPISVNLQTGATSGAAAAGDIFISIENLRGSNYGDTLIGDGNNNVLEGGGGDDTIDGGGGFNTASYEHASTGVTVSLAVSGRQDTVGAAFDTLTNIQALRGSAFDDTLTGNGSSVLEGGLGDDHLIGQSGQGDTASYEHASGGVHVDLSKTTVQDTVGAGSDTLTNIANLSGSHFNDILTGDSHDNFFMGNGGSDIFVFKQTGIGHDTIGDFVSGQTRIQLDYAAFDATNAESFNAWYADHVHANGGDLLIDLSQSGMDGTDTILLKNASIGGLHVNDFILHPGGGNA